MTDAEWEACESPTQLLAVLRDRLTARQLWQLVAELGRELEANEDPRVRRALDLARRTANGDGDAAELNNAWFAAFGFGGYEDQPWDAAEDLFELAQQSMGAMAVAQRVRALARDIG